MHYFLTEEQQMIVDICRQIVNDRIIPVRAENDEKGIFPADIIKEIGKAIFSGFLFLKNMAEWAPVFLKSALPLKSSAGVI